MVPYRPQGTAQQRADVSCRWSMFFVLIYRTNFGHCKVSMAL